MPTRPAQKSWARQTLIVATRAALCRHKAGDGPALLKAHRPNPTRWSKVAAVYP